MSGQINMKDRKLPQNFWEQVLILEYQLSEAQQKFPIDKLQTLIHLFCGAIEYYQSIDDPRYIELQQKMQTILVKEHVLRALEEQAKQKKLSSSQKQRSNGSFLTPHGQSKVKKDRKTSFYSYGTESQDQDEDMPSDDQKDLFVEQIKQSKPRPRKLTASFAYTSPNSKQLSSTFDDSEEVNKKRKSAAAHSSFIALEELLHDKRGQTQTSAFKVGEINPTLEQAPHHISQKMLRIGRKQIDQPEKLLKNVITDYQNKVQEIKKDYDEQKAGFEQRIAAARAKRKMLRRQKQKLKLQQSKQQTKEQGSLSLSMFQPSDQKNHWNSINRDELQILANSPTDQNESIDNLQQKYYQKHINHFQQILKQSISSPNVLQNQKNSKESKVNIPRFFDSRRTRSFRDFSHQAAQQQLLHSMNQMPSAIMSMGGMNKFMMLQNQSAEYINQQVYLSDEDDDEELMGEDEIQQNVIQPMWIECEERFRVKQEKLQQMKEDVIQRNVNSKLQKVREITAVYNKKIKEKMGNQINYIPDQSIILDQKCTGEQIKQLQAQKQQEIKLIKEKCDKIKAKQLENLKKVYEEKNDHNLMQDGEKEEKIEQLTSKLVHKLNNF